MKLKINEHLELYNAVRTSTNYIVLKIIHGNGGTGGAMKIEEHG